MFTRLGEIHGKDKMTSTSLIEENISKIIILGIELKATVDCY
jgi:hypothetical protein